MLNVKPYLQRVRIDRENVENLKAFPFSVPAISAIDEIEFHQDVTFIVGENGSGKSTLIEAIAFALGFGAEGGTKNVQTSSTEDLSVLSRHIKLERGFRRPGDDYFLRAESFYNVATYMDDVGYLGGYGGKSLHARSHGEAFWSVLCDKLRGNGLYIFDEPEAALSPNRQLAAITRIHELVGQQSQFVIATHSPILMSYPHARILQLGADGLQEVAYEQTEHYQVTRDFLNRHQAMLRYLMEP